MSYCEELSLKHDDFIAVAVVACFITQTWCLLFTTTSLSIRKHSSQMLNAWRSSTTSAKQYVCDFVGVSQPVHFLSGVVSRPFSRQTLPLPAVISVYYYLTVHLTLSGPCSDVFRLGHSKNHWTELLSALSLELAQNTAQNSDVSKDFPYITRNMHVALFIKINGDQVVADIM